MDILQERYASPEMIEAWAPQSRVMVERGLWILVMRAQGVDPAVVADYQAHLKDVDLESIRQRELQTGHDLKARLEEFNHLAGHQAAHRGLTSADITESATSWAVYESMTIIAQRVVSVAARLAGLIGLYGSTPMVGRTHNLPAQVTTVGLRFAHCTQDLSAAFNALRHHMQIYSMRGLWGAVGTAADLLRTANLPAGSYSSAYGWLMAVNGKAAHTMRIPAMQTSARQVGNRGQDAMVASAVTALCAAVSNTATTIRLMVGQGLAAETPRPGQTGSSAMPHKANPRYAERTCGLLTVVRGYAHMLDDRIGDIWNEGDITDSCVRRVALPGLFLAADGLLRTFMVALDRFEPDIDAITAELQEYRAEMQTGQLLEALVAKGVGREDAHAMIRDHTRGIDWRMHDYLDMNETLEVLAKPWDLGAAAEQCDAGMAWCKNMMDLSPEGANYVPGDML